MALTMNFIIDTLLVTELLKLVCQYGMCLKSVT